MKEIVRHQNKFQKTLLEKINCLKCGKGIELHHNGGELDQRDCCDLRYSGEIVQIDIVIEEIATE